MNGESNLILGISGVGKTTLAPLWQLLATKLEKQLDISATSREAAAQINPEGMGTKYKVRFKGILRGQSAMDVSDRIRRHPDLVRHHIRSNARVDDECFMQTGDEYDTEFEVEDYLSRSIGADCTSAFSGVGSHVQRGPIIKHDEQQPERKFMLDSKLLYKKIGSRIFIAQQPVRYLNEKWAATIEAAAKNKINEHLKGTQARFGANGIVECIAATRKYTEVDFLTDVVRDQHVTFLMSRNDEAWAKVIWFAEAWLRVPLKQVKVFPVTRPIPEWDFELTERLSHEPWERIISATLEDLFDGNGHGHDERRLWREYLSYAVPRTCVLVTHVP